MSSVAAPATDTTNVATVKGSILAALLDFLDEELTPSQRAEVFTRVDPMRTRIPHRTVLPSDRVSVSLLNSVVATAAAVRGEPLASFARRVGRAGAEANLKGIYRLFARILTPAFQLSKASALWSSIYNCGRLQAISHGSNAATIRLLDFRCEAAMCERIHGWLERMNEMTGSKSTHVEQPLCCSRGDDHCEWEVSWT